MGGGVWVHIFLFIFNMLTTCSRYPVDIILMVTSSYCYIVSILAVLLMPHDCRRQMTVEVSPYSVSFIPFCQMEGSGSPRFRKLHFPVGLWINSPRKHFAKLGGRWPSAVSVKSVFSLLLSLIFFSKQAP